MQRHRRRGRQFGAQIAQLDRQHVDDVERSARRHALGQVFGEISIDAGHLQRAPRNLVSEFRQGGIAQPGEVAPQNQIDQPLPLEETHRIRMDVGPPVSVLQVTRNRLRPRQPQRLLFTFAHASRLVVDAATRLAAGRNMPHPAAVRSPSFDIAQRGKAPAE